VSTTEPAPIIVVGHLTVDADNRDDYLHSCAPVVAAARSTNGCLDFAIGADLVDPNRINVYERWRDRPTLEAFRQEGPDDDQMSMLIAIEVSEYRVQSSEGDT
jgi:quinol monooxygenase YgiN